MRVLIIGVDNPWRMERAVQRALERAGHTTLLFDDRRSARWIGRRLTQGRALRVARKFKPDFVFLSKCRRLDVSTVVELLGNLPNAMWYHDPQWYNDLQNPEIAHIAAVGEVARTFFVTGFVEEWRAHGLNARFLPAAAASEIQPVAPDPQFAATISFIGSGYDPQRAEFLRALSARVPTRVYGPGWDAWRDELQWNGGEVAGSDFAAACSSSEFALGILPERASGATVYASDRMWMVVLAGGLYLGPWAAGLDQMLIDGEHCVWYRDLDDCVARVERLMAAPADRQRIRSAGEAFVRAHHTYDARLSYLLSGESWVNPLSTTPSVPPPRA
ncbi:MAG TPA: glycosyltransferase [Gemmatimonadaceae bacterium]|nr:glycosyltransferase [Gemmatimonadaceae bacterium]